MLQTLITLTVAELLVMATQEEQQEKNKSFLTGCVTQAAAAVVQAAQDKVLHKVLKPITWLLAELVVLLQLF
jgi:hypothetical protein